MEISDSIYKSFIFTNEDTEMKGGYQFQKTIRRSIKRTPSLRTPSLIGGSDETDYSRFENLVIPLGLVLNSYTTLDNKIPVKEYTQECIPNEVFDTLFDTMKYEKKGSNHSKKNKPNMINNLTKKLLP